MNIVYHPMENKNDRNMPVGDSDGDGAVYESNHDDDDSACTCLPLQGVFRRQQEFHSQDDILTW